MEKNKTLTEANVMQALDQCYRYVCNGIPKVSPPVTKMADDYRKTEADPSKAAKRMIHNQVLKCATSGFITGFGGVLSLPVTIPANVGSVLYVQMRMIACTAYLAGFDLSHDEVQTLIYTCLAGLSMDEFVKSTGIKLGTKVARKAIEKIPGKTLTKINQKVGFRLVTKFGEKGIVNMGKLIPGVGGVVGGSFDYVETKAVGKRAYDIFFGTKGTK